MLLSAILLLSSIQFVKADVSAKLVVNVHMLEKVAQLLDMSSDKLTQTLTNQTKYVSRCWYTIFFWVLNRAWCNKTNLCRICMPFYSPLSLRLPTTIFVLPLMRRLLLLLKFIILDWRPVFQNHESITTRSMMLTGGTLLVSMYRQNTFDEFTINFANKYMQSYDWQWHYSSLHPNNEPLVLSFFMMVASVDVYPASLGAYLVLWPKLIHLTSLERLKIKRQRIFSRLLCSNLVYIPFL